MHGARIHAQVRTWEPTPPLPLAASTRLRLRTCWPNLPPGADVNVTENATVVLPVSNEKEGTETNCLFLLLMFTPPATGGGDVIKCKCSRSGARESRKSRVHTVLISRSRNLEAGKHAKTSCGYAAAPSRAGFETKERSTQKTCPARSLQPKLPLVIAQVLFTLATRQARVLGGRDFQHVGVYATEL